MKKAITTTSTSTTTLSDLGWGMTKKVPTPTEWTVGTAQSTVAHSISPEMQAWMRWWDLGIGRGIDKDDWDFANDQLRGNGTRLEDFLAEGTRILRRFRKEDGEALYVLD